jgi:sugar phosphate isomerase/epimerase
MNSTLMSRSPWPLGVVSNCWRVQLEAGVDLDLLIEEAVRRSFRAVELRQSCMGKYEFGSQYLPRPDRLSELAPRFPTVRFNLAMSLPCLSGDLKRNSPLFVASRAAAGAVAWGKPSHLRLVDLQTRPEQRPQLTVEAAASGLTDLVESLIEVRGTLSVENSIQPWTWFHAVVSEARRRLGENSSRLRCCLDPCNLLETECAEDVRTIVDSLSPDEVSLIHVKQRRDGQILPDVSQGDLDWPDLLDTLHHRGHQGPVLFETTPHVDVWRNLETSVAHLFGRSQSLCNVE